MRTMRLTQHAYARYLSGDRSVNPAIKTGFVISLRDHSNHTIARHIKTSAVFQGAPNAAASILNNRLWLLDSPAVPITHVRSSDGQGIEVIRDDLLHPYISGNKRRKLDALWPTIQQQNVTDVVTCGGVQSAHVVAVAATAAESGGIKSHLLVRGEAPEVPAGNHLFARMFGHHVEYVPRSKYANRRHMFETYIQKANLDITKTAIIPEGGAEVLGLLGMIRLVSWLESDIGRTPATIVVDSGTGTTAVGIAIGAALMNLDWKVIGVMLAGPIDYYEQQAQALVDSFCQQHIGLMGDGEQSALAANVSKQLYWVERLIPRTFGRVLPGEIQKCKIIGQKYGILVDPIWTLAAWEEAQNQALSSGGQQKRDVFMYHTGGSGQLCGVAQRFPESF